jgi:glycosyltransferase involved in cell wall biosynthesis
LTQPKITIAICTYNRSDALEGSVSSSFDQETTFPFDVLVVDNNSTDDTQQVLQELKSRYPALRCVREEKQGLSHARNRALEESSAEIVAYIDDDCFLLPGWLQAIWEGFDAPDVGIVGGITHVGYPDDERPDWMTTSIEGLLGYHYEGPDKKECLAAYGGNMAMRRQLVLDLGGFETNLGYAGKSKVPGEDIDISRRIAEAGYKVMYLPDAELIHRVDPPRLELGWLAERMRQNGRFCAVVFPDRFTAWETAQSCVDARMRAFIHRLTRNRKKWMSCHMESLQTGGQLDVQLPGFTGRLRRLLLLALAVPAVSVNIALRNALGRAPEKTDWLTRPDRGGRRQ